MTNPADPTPPATATALTSVFTRDEVEALMRELPPDALTHDYVMSGDTDRVARVVGAYPKLLRTIVGLFALLDASQDDIERLEGDSDLAELYRVAHRFHAFGEPNTAESAMGLALSDLGAVSSALLPTATAIWRALGKPDEGDEELAASARQGIAERLLRNGALRRQWAAYLARFDALASAVDMAAAELGCEGMPPMPTTGMGEAMRTAAAKELIDHAEAKANRLERELAGATAAAGSRVDSDPRIGEFLRVCGDHVREQRRRLNSAPIVMRAVGPGGENVPGQLIAASPDGVSLGVRGILPAVPPGGQLVLNFGNTNETFASVVRGADGAIESFMAPAEASAVREEDGA